MTFNRRAGDALPPELAPYLAHGAVVDWGHPLVAAQASALAQGNDDELTARRCFEFVRDDIKHSWDYRLNPVTCSASEVLRHATGYCYAKSHLLAALLRANGIPAALCYQRLSLHDGLYCLHGLNAVYLKRYGWYRADARGNKAGVTAAFCPPVEQLAFSVDGEGEADLPGIFAEPWPQVTQVLTQCRNVAEVYGNLPDCTLE